MVQAAERINFTYNTIPFSITTQDLENFSKNNKTSESFEFYINQISSEQRKSLLEFLTTNYRYSPLVINRVLQEPIAASVLSRVGYFIKTPFDKNGSRYLKTALLKSAISAKGFTTLDVIRNFPYDIQLDVESIVKISRESQSLKRETQDLVSIIKSQADKEASTAWLKSAYH